MTEKNNKDSRHNIALWFTVAALTGIMVLGIAQHLERRNTRHKIIKLTNAIKQNNDDRFTYTIKGPEFVQNTHMKRTVDSLKARNAELVTQGNADEIAHNQRAIDSLQNCMDGNGFIIANTLAEFNRKNDSLNVLLEKNREKLK
jgi:hypothetical protein